MQVGTPGLSGSQIQVMLMAPDPESTAPHAVQLVILDPCVAHHMLTWSVNP